MFYLYKQGVGGRGVFWIGEDLEEGKRVADYAANKDKDDYHSWDLHEYSAPDDSTDWEWEPTSKIVYTGKRKT